ncbi:carbohydrate-binding protein [Hymenobacter humi]|uniref:Carbohydrate-binding protein n=1 Tax=Hymenobacter humi TaxID=1411620 RepID=A0ABW2U887_9BACT
MKAVSLRGTSAAGATLQIRLDNAAGPVVAEVTVPKGSAWQEVKAPVRAIRPGTHALFVAPKSPAATVEVDWVRFE